MSASQAQQKELVGRSEALISPFKAHCQGSRDPNSYFVALNVTAAKTAKRFAHGGSSTLDAINAFDQAEVKRMNLGQINLIEVSSFCGPGGMIWGYDAAQPDGLCEKPMFILPQWDGANVPVYDGEPLIGAAAALFGSIDDRRFPMAPGTHCPAAHKCITLDKPGTIYAACGIGMRDPRDESASMLMEDVGMLTEEMRGDRAGWREKIRRSAAESVLAIAANQRTRCSKIFVVYAEIDVAEGEDGCALTLLPYFSLAQDAVPAEGVERLRTLSLAEWSAGIKA